MYGNALVKDATMQEALQRLRALTNLEARAMTSETRVDVAETRHLASNVQADVAQNVAISAHLLSELQKLNRGVLCLHATLYTPY